MFNEESVKETLEVLIGDQFYKANLFEEDVDSLRKLHPKKYNKQFYKKYDNIFRQRPKTNVQVSSLK